MIEVYTNSYGRVDIEVRDSSGELVNPDGNINVEIFDYDLVDPGTGNIGSIIDSGTATQVSYNGVAVTGRYYYELTPDETEFNRNLRASWSFQVSGENRSGQVNVFVVTPYVSISSLRMIRELNEFSDYDLFGMERLVSRVIDTYCGQSFGSQVNASKTAIGAGSDYLWLPARLTSLTSVKISEEERDVTEYTVLDKDNPWRIRNRRDYEYDPVSEIDPKTFFKNGVIYVIKGNWGYRYVPPEITEAAKILVKTYFYDDSAYRERYISDIKAGQWSMKFTATGDSTTGSANADMILSAYRNINAAVI